MKRATYNFIKNDLSLGISIHALVKRATEPTDEELKKFDISIHALVKRATYDISAV